MALGALIIKARLGLTDEELVDQTKENPYLEFFIDLEAFQYSAPFDPSIWCISGLLNKGRSIAAQWISAVFDGKMYANGPF